MPAISSRSGSATSHLLTAMTVAQCAPGGLGADGQVELAEAQGRVDHDDGHVRAVEALDAAQVRVVLDAADLGRLAHAGRVDEAEAAVPRLDEVSMASRVVPAISLTIVRGSPAMALKSDDLPALGRPTMATGISAERRFGRLLHAARDGAGDLDQAVEQVADAEAVQGGERQRLAEAELRRAPRPRWSRPGRRSCWPPRSPGPWPGAAPRRSRSRRRGAPRGRRRTNSTRSAVRDRCARPARGWARRTASPRWCRSRRCRRTAGGVRSTRPPPPCGRGSRPGSRGPRRRASR